MIRKILIPLDLSSLEPAKLAVRLARVFPCELVFLHCLASSPLSARLFFPRKHDSRLPEVSAQERRFVEQRMAEMVAALAAADLRHSLRIVKGAVLHEVVRAIDSVHPDWIIQGRRASLRGEEWLTGGISRGVMEKAPCPVITLPHPSPSSRLVMDREELPASASDVAASKPHRESFSSAKIIFLTAFGESSMRALPAAAMLAGKTGAELFMVHLRTDPPDHPKASDPGKQLQLLVEKAKALQRGLEVSPCLYEGNPEDLIGKFIRPGTGDMVVMGLGRQSGPPLFQDRLIETVLRKAACPVMTVGLKGISAGVEERYRQIYRRLTPEDLFQISEAQPERVGEELFGGSRAMRPSELFLKYYSQAGLIRIFEEYGLFSLLRQKGFTDPKLFLKLDDPFRQRLRICSGDSQAEEHLLIEMVLHEGILESARTKDGPGRGHYFSVLMVEWLLMQNPKASFTRERPPLPGQRYPGLGLSREILQLIALIGLRIGKDGIAIHPQHFHAALLYHRLFQCYNPIQEGQLCALLRDTEPWNLDDVSWAIELDCLFTDRPDEKGSWHVESQVHPLTSLLKNHFHSESYRKLFWQSLSGHHYRIDWPLFEKRFQDRVKGRAEASTGLNRSGGGSVRAVRNPGESLPS